MTKIASWPTRALYILVALTLVLSLSVTGVVPGAGSMVKTVLAADPDSPALLVYIERPGDGSEFKVGDIFYVNAVVAYKDIYEKGTSRVQVAAVIDTGHNARVVEGENESKFASINRNCLGDFWWKVECTGEGETTITVTAVGAQMQGQNSVTVIQGEPAPECGLSVTRIQPKDDPYRVEVGDRYDVKVMLTNYSDKIATDVTVCIEIDPDSGAVLTGGEPHCWNMGDIRPGKPVYVGWNLQCRDDSVVDITVTATAGNVIVCPPLELTVLQGELPEEEGECLDVDVVAIKDGEVVDKVCTIGCGYNDYFVTATIYNDCAAPCANVTATLSWTPGDGATLGVGETKTKDVGTMPGDSSMVVAWNVTCIGLEPVTFKVNAEGGCGRASGTTDVEQKKVLARLIEPASGTLETHNVCTTFNVTANITNCDCFGMEQVNVKLLWPDTVQIREDTRLTITQYNAEGTTFTWQVDLNDLADPRSYNFSSFCACCIYEMRWTDLHCKAVSPHEELVWLQVFDKEGNLLDDDHFRLMQTEKAHLSTGVEIFPYTGAESNNDDPAPCTMGTTPLEALAVGQQFMIVVPVMNTGGATARDVYVSVNITGETDTAGNYTYYIDEIPGGEASKIFIPARCTGDGDVIIRVWDVSGIDAGTGESIPEDNLFPCGYKRIKQIPIEIEIVQPDPKEQFTCLDYFDVKVKVANQSGNKGHDLKGVTATISWDGPARFHPGAPSGYGTKQLGNLEAGKEVTVLWNMQCTDAGRVYFDVTLESADPAWSQTKSFYVDQVPYAQLYVEILSPMSEAWYGTGEEFAVTAKVWADSRLPGVTHVHGAEATIPDYDWLDVDGPRTIPLGTLAVGYDNAKIVSWTVRAVKSGTQCHPIWTYLVVEADGPCAGWAYYEKDIIIYPAANLVVEITEDPQVVGVGDKFKLAGRVTNTGWADAASVKLQLAVQPPDSALALSGYTINIGTLIGYGQHDVEGVGYKEFSVTMQFVPESWPPMADITITPSGYDECGWYLHDWWGTWYTSAANRPIADKFLHSDSVVVIQTDEDDWLKSITAEPDDVSLPVNGTQQLTVTATRADETTHDATAAADYASSHTAVAAVSGTGLITAVAEGTATITVSYTEDGITRKAQVSVKVETTRELQSIAAVPDNVSLPVNGTQQLTVTATYSDASTATVTNAADYASSNTAVATVSATGLITAVAEGTATITVSYTEDGITRTAPVAVNVADVSSIVVYYRDNHGAAGVCDIDSVLAIISDWLNDVTPTGFGQPPTIDDVLEMIGCWLAT